MKSWFFSFQHHYFVLSLIIYLYQHSINIFSFIFWNLILPLLILELLPRSKEVHISMVAVLILPMNQFRWIINCNPYNVWYVWFIQQNLFHRDQRPLVSHSFDKFHFSFQYSMKIHFELVHQSNIPHWIHPKK